MKVLMISFSVNGAMGDNFKMIARDLSKLCEVSVLTNKSVKPEDVGTDRICNVRFDRKMMVDFINPVSYCKIYRYIKKTAFDVCFIYSPHPVNLFIYHIVNHKQIISFVHDHRLHSGVGRLDGFFLKANLKYSYTKSAKIIVSCLSIKDDILSLGLMINKEKIAVNYLGLLENLVYPKRELEQDIDVLFFGRIEYYKGLDVLIEASICTQSIIFTHKNARQRGEFHLSSAGQRNRFQLRAFCLSRASHSLAHSRHRGHRTAMAQSLFLGPGAVHSPAAKVGVQKTFPNQRHLSTLLSEIPTYLQGVWFCCLHYIPSYPYCQ